MIIAQREQLLQTFGSIGASAGNSAAEGIAKAAQTDSKTVDAALKLFGGFDRIEFENIYGAPVPEDGQPVPDDGAPPNLLTPAVRPPASYEGPSEYFKPLSNTVEGQGLLVPAKDLLQQLQDPRFRMTDGLSGFSNNRITQTLAQKVMSGADENGIIVIGGGKPDFGDMTASLDSLGKLYRMENTVAKQLQLHQQLDFGAIRFSAPKQPPLPTADNPKLPDAQAAAPQSKEMLNLTLDHALNGTPQTVGEMTQMLDVMIVKMEKIIKKMPGPDNIGMKFLVGLAYLDLVELQDECQKLPTNSSPTEELLAKFEKVRKPCKYFLGLD